MKSGSAPPSSSSPPTSRKWSGPSILKNVSVNDYAARMGVTQSAISHRLQTVKKKLKKLLG